MFTAAQARELIPHLVSASIGASPKNFPKILSVNAVRAESSKFNGAKPSHVLGKLTLLNFFNSNEWARSQS